MLNRNWAINLKMNKLINLCRLLSATCDTHDDTIRVRQILHYAKEMGAVCMYVTSSPIKKYLATHNA